jgi:hypothetical protein
MAAPFAGQPPGCRISQAVDRGKQRSSLRRIGVTPIADSAGKMRQAEIRHSGLIEYEKFFTIGDLRQIRCKAIVLNNITITNKYNDIQSLNASASLLEKKCKRFHFDSQEKTLERIRRDAPL